MPTLSELLAAKAKQEGVTLEVAQEGGTPSVSAEATKHLGKGWSAAATLDWAKATGLRYAAKIGWTPAPKAPRDDT